jgi:outer membrane receptor protein involved in Fe transport
MKTILLLLAGLCFTAFSFGQLSISGTVADGHEKLPSVTILLLDLDSAFIDGVVTNISGDYILEHVKPGEYIVAASMVGYTKFFSESLLLTDQHISLPEIILKESATQLGEIVIKEQRQLIDQEIDRMVINLESSISSSGNTISEVLQKSPGIVLNRQNNTITMNGKSGVRIMVNEKIIQVPLEVVLQMLDGMSASNVEKIELITSPPAKYDAEGNGGIIHIITKSNEDLGTNYSLGLFLGKRWAEAMGGNVNVSHRGSRISYFADYSISSDHNLHVMQMKRRWWMDGSAQSEEAHSDRENITIQQNISSGVEWKPGKKTTWNVLFTGYRRNWQLDAFTTDKEHAAANAPIVTGMGISESNVWQSATGSIGMQSHIDARSAIHVTFDYLYYHNNNPSRYHNNLLDNASNDPASEIDVKKTTPIRFLIGNVDYQTIISPAFTCEVGMKSVSSTLDNSVFVQRGIENEWAPDPAFSSFSNIQEQVSSAYVSSKWNVGTAWQINSGLRYEYTHTSIGTPGQKNLVNRKYGYFFPSFSLKKTLQEEKDFHFSYGRRITRPTYNDMAPYVYFWGPNTFSAGNTSLYPAIADAITAGYHVKQWIMSLRLTHSRNEIVTWQGEQDQDTNNFTFRSQNLKYLNTLALMNSYSIDLCSWWKIQSNVTIQYQVAETSHLQNNATLSIYGLNAYMLHQLKLPKAFSIEVSGLYQSKSRSGTAQYLSFGSLNAGVQKNFGIHGILRLSMDDILGTNNWRIRTNSPENNLDVAFNYYWHNRFIRLGYTRNFGNNKLKSVKMSSGSDEERRRVN